MVHLADRDEIWCWSCQPPLQASKKAGLPRSVLRSELIVHVEAVGGVDMSLRQHGCICNRHRAALHAPCGMSWGDGKMNIPYQAAAGRRRLGPSGGRCGPIVSCRA